MTTQIARDPKTDHMLTPENSALILIDFQPGLIDGTTSVSRDILGVCAAETIEGKDLGMAEGGYAVQAWTLRHAAQEERGRGRHVGVHGVGAA